MNQNSQQQPPPRFGGWQDAEDLRKWSFLRRTPQQRLDWLIEALTIAYRCGALEAGAPPPAPSSK